MITPEAPNASAERTSVPMFPVVVGRSKGHNQQVRSHRYAPGPVHRQLDHCEQLRRSVILAAELPHQRRRQRRPVAGDLIEHAAGPPGQTLPVRVQQCADRPTVRHRQRDRAYPLHQELARPLALAAVGEQRVPPLEGRVPRGDPQGPRHGAYQPPRHPASRTSPCTARRLTPAPCPPGGPSHHCGRPAG